MRFFIVVLLLLPCLLRAQDRFVIEGVVERPGNIRYVYLQSAGAMDSAAVAGGRFSFQGMVGTPYMAVLIALHEGATREGANGYDELVVYVEPGILQLSVRDSLAHAVIKGGAVNKQFQAYLKRMQPISARMQWLMRRSQDSSSLACTALQDSLAAAFTEVARQQLDTAVAIIDQYPADYYSVVLLHQLVSNPALDREQAKRLFMSLTPSLKETDPGKAVYKALYELVAELGIGSSAPDFVQPDTSGCLFRLSELRGKYVLVDFWASWCAPCRAENPYLLAAYEQFKDKNFCIVSVSLDSKKDAWMKAISDDGLVWWNVSDLAYWKNEAARLFNVRAVPQNFLLDPAGRVIAMQLKGKQLEEKLAQLLNKH